VSRPRYVALLRAITNVPMKPFRRALGELGFTDVESCATSGTLLFNARARGPAALERRIATRVGTAAFVRTRIEMARVVAEDPLGAMVVFLAHPPAAAAKRHAFLDPTSKNHIRFSTDERSTSRSRSSCAGAHAVRYRARFRRSGRVSYRASGGCVEEADPAQDPVDTSDDA
jgi:hypothetical protein